MKDNKVIIITTILNLIVALLKLAFGIAFSFSTLIADSVQSFIDFITDIMSLIANKIGKRRANKTYPFGYGQIYYIANLFTGFLLFLIGIFILYQFFFFTGEFKPNYILVIGLVVIILLKFIVIMLLHYFGTKYKSELMIESYKESKADFISTCVVFIIMTITFFENFMPSYINVDKIGSLGMALYVFYVSIKMMVSNVRGTLTNDEENNEIREEIINELKNIKELKIKRIRIIKMATYYSVFLQVIVNENLTIKKYLNIEKNIKVRLKNINKSIRFIDIEPIEN
ncbi:MAG: cation diffusion facilitator family transporter [Bacilli bacterium]|jgi:cobalt-zinc-cadmium efflux system protein|nr:cation diffusion facilitator family transporter [Bacilli bacterium]